MKIDDYSLKIFSYCDVLSITSVMAMKVGTMEMVMVVVDGNDRGGSEGLT